MVWKDVVKTLNSFQHQQKRCRDKSAWVAWKVAQDQLQAWHDRPDSRHVRHAVEGWVWCQARAWLAVASSSSS